MTQEWTPERAAALITLWTEGICASEIGRRLSVTKNAVIGKAFRLQLPKRRPTLRDFLALALILGGSAILIFGAPA